jgi:hypothetical protein
VRDVRLIMDRNSRRSKGVGYVSSVSTKLSFVYVHLVRKFSAYSVFSAISRIRFCILRCTSNAIMMRMMAIPCTVV